MNCPDCGNKMKFDGTGYSIQEQEYHEWWICEKCDKMHIEIIPC